MGFALTVVYIVLTIISPEQFGPEWAHYHALQFLAGIIAVVSLPNMLNQPYLKSSIQTFLLLGLFVAIALSQVANGWFGGALISWQTFLPSAVIFFFVVANVTTIRRLKIVTLATIASCMVVVVEALFGYYGGYRGDMFVLHDHLYSHDEIVGDIFRLRGVGFLNDPNDFAQILLIALPLLFIIWQRRRFVYNSLFVLVPASILLWGIYLTHSRGALLGSAVLALMAARDNLGATVSAVLTSGLVFGMMALDFTGGRGISASEGADRLEAWASGLELFKSAPIFGVGFSNFADLNGITAHNSFVLCLAELGLVGSMIWVALLVTTMMSLNSIVDLHEKWETTSVGHKITPSKAPEHGEEEILSAAASANDDTFGLNGETHTTPLTVVEEPISGAAKDSDGGAAITTAAHMLMNVGNESDVSPPHVVPKQWVVVMRLALISFMTTGWFLSRTYSSTMYLVLGLAVASVALEGTFPEFRSSARWIFLTLAIHAALILFIYVVVRFRY